MDRNMTSVGPNRDVNPLIPNAFETQSRLTSQLDQMRAERDELTRAIEQLEDNLRSVLGIPQLPSPASAYSGR